MQDGFGLGFGQIIAEKAMKRHLHWWVTVLFAWALLYDLVVWGGAANIPDIGDKLQASAQRQALFAHIYMSGGSALDDAVPVLADWGRIRAETALSPGFERIREDPLVAMDLIFSNTWNATQGTLKFAYWAAPALGLLALFFWARRPRKVSLIGRR